MCNRSLAPNELEMKRLFHIGRANPVPWPRQVFPRSPGPFSRRARDEAGYERELAVLEPAGWDQWLAGTVAEARDLLRLAPVEAFEVGPTQEMT